MGTKRQERTPMLTEKQIDDLRQKTPHELTVPSNSALDGEPCKAVLRWLAASSAAVSGVDFDTVFADDERLGMYPEFAALWYLRLAERQATGKMPPTEETHASAIPEVHPALARAASLHRSMVRLETETLLEQFKISIEMEEPLAERAELVEKIRVLDKKLWAHYRSLKDVQFRMVDPGVVTGYFHDRRVPDVSRRTALQYYLCDVRKLPLLRCMAITGALQNDASPVDLDHPALETIYETEERRLKRYREKIRRSQGTHRHGVYLSPGPGDGSCSSPGK
jgi:hypothetical protein